MMTTQQGRGDLNSIIMDFHLKICSHKGKSLEWGNIKRLKNMFPTYTKRHILEQSDILHARGDGGIDVKGR